MIFRSPALCAIALLLFLSKIHAQDFQEQDGLRYKIFVQHNGKKPQVGETAMIDMIFYGDKDQPIFSSLDKNQPVPVPISKSQFKGDLMQGLQMLSVGDSAIFLVNGDSIIKISGSAGNIKPGSYLKYVVKLRSIYNPEAQKKADDKIITQYLKKNKIKGVKRTSTGLYYKITQKGTGDKPKDGQTVSAHYTGKLLDGKEFDSDKGAGFSFEMGKHQVIPGWEEGFSLLKKGSKATLFLPSTLAYGVSGGGPIPPNAVLIFDVELTDLK
jgi:FKBP-type peptidyl-prolyl cis-trans isomerase FkpA